jgi:hypothetical protein
MRIENETSWSTADLTAFLAQAWDLVEPAKRRNRIDGTGDTLLNIKHWGGAALTIKVKRTRSEGIWELKIPRPKRILPNVIERLANVGADEGANSMTNEWKQNLAFAALHVVLGQHCDTRYKQRIRRTNPAFSGEWGEEFQVRALPTKLGRGTTKAQMLLDIEQREYAAWLVHVAEEDKRRKAAIAGLEADLEALKQKQPKKKQPA